ncbi:MAG: CBS domain-containing protein, partial [Desulfomonilia bacterium]|nr:CBS domain-containing protein [Desulfomonilia bacterium]
MFLRDIMTCSFERLRSSDNLREAARLFRETHLEALPVADNQGRFAGIMTKANLFDALVKGVQPDVPIHGLFTTDVLMLNENMPYDEVKEIVRTSRAGNAVVINDCQEITGVLTKAGLIMSMLKQETKLNSELNAILQTMYNGLLVLDTNSTVVKLNRAAEKILSTTQDRAGGMRADSLLPGIKLDEVLIGGRPSVGYLYTGQDMSLLCNITPIAREGAITGAIIVFQDVTDLVRIIAELESVTKLYRTLQSVMDLAYDGIIVVDEQGLISMANQAAERFLRRNENHILGRPVEEVIENTMIMKVIRTGVPELNRLQFISGTPYVVSCLPIIRKGQVVGAVGKILFRNLDEIKDLARKLAHVDPEIAGSVRPEPKETETWHGFHQIVTADPAFRQFIDEAESVSRGASNILITGESGTGKELIAQ